MAPVGGGNGGIFAQAWRYQQSPPDSAPYSSAPVAGSSTAAPFNTLNALILSYIDSALSSIVPSDTGGSNVPTTPAGMSLTASDGLGTYTFSASASYNIDGQYVAGSFSTTDNATLSYSFGEVGYTPDGNQFTLNDTGGATLNVNADNGNSTTHFLTNTLTGSDSYALVQVLDQSDAVAGSYTSAESTIESVGGSDSFTLSETQTETVNTSGTITGGSDTYTYSESGNDTSSLSDIGDDSVSGVSGINEASGSSSAGAGGGGYTMLATGADSMATLGFLPSGSNSFTWGESDSESATTSESDSDTDDDSGDSETDSAAGADTQSESESNGETGSENYTDTEGTNFGWTETVGYAINDQDQGSDQGTETGGETDIDTDGGDIEGDGGGDSTTDGGGDSGSVASTLTVTGTQALSGGIISSGNSTFTWTQNVSDTPVSSETDSASDSTSDSGTVVDSGDTDSYSDGETDTDADTVTTTIYAIEAAQESDAGQATMGSYGLLSGGSMTESQSALPLIFSYEQDSEGDTVTQTQVETDDAGGGMETDQLSDVETGQDTSSAAQNDFEFDDGSTGTMALGAGGLVVGSSLAENVNPVVNVNSVETDAVEESGTESDAMAGEADTDSFGESNTDSVTEINEAFDFLSDVEVDTVTVGAGGSVVGGSESSSVEPWEGVYDYAYVTQTDTNTALNSATDSYSEGGESLSDSESTSESDLDVSTEDDFVGGFATDNTSLVLGTAGVVLSGTGGQYQSIADELMTENDSDTGGSNVQEVDTESDDVGGTTNSDSLSISETGTDSTTNTEYDTGQSSSTLNLNYGPGGLVTGGTQTDGETDDESTTVIVNDSSSNTGKESTTDSDLEAADDVSNTVTDTEDDTDSDNETDTDTGSSGEQDIIVFGAGMDELSGNSTASETDSGDDNDTNVDTATVTAQESDSSSETVGGEVTTDSAVDSSTETDAVTDTEGDTPTNTEQSTVSTGVAGLVLGGSSTDTLDDTGTLGESDDDDDVDKSTETLSDDDDGASTDSSSEKDITTSTDSQTLTGSDSGPDSLTEVTSQIIGVAGLITGGAVEQLDSGADSGSWDTTDSGSDTDTDIDNGDEQDTGDDACESESSHESGSYTSSGSADTGSTEYESMTETLGDGGVVVSGASTEATSESSGSTQSTTETDGESDSFNATSSEEEGADNDSGSDSGSDTITETDTAPSTLIETVTETLGADGTVAGGFESDSLSEATGATTTETDLSIETVTDLASNVTMTLTETNTTTDTDNESDQDWASETLGASATISGGSDCFTVDTLDTSSYVSSGSGPENYNDTSDDPNGDATVDGSGSSSSQVDQTFGDTLGSGGVIASGSLSYTDSNSDTDAETKTESGTETIPDENYSLSQTASYTVTTTNADTDSAFETGTETLGGGGTISGGSASFTLSDGDSVNRNLAVSGITATLTISETGTDTYGFGDSGTETITTGGADAPGTVSFVWNQMGTDSYALNQANSSTTTSDGASYSDSYSLALNDTVSSSWHDAGADFLTGSDTLSGVNDTYNWNDMHSLTDSYEDDYANTGGASSSNGESGLESFSIADVGSDTLSGSSLVAGADSYTIAESVAAGSTPKNSAPDGSPTEYGSDSNSGVLSYSYSFLDVGSDSQSGTLSLACDSYSVEQYSNAYLTASDSTFYTGDTGVLSATEEDSSSLQAVGTDSIGPADAHQSSLSVDIVLFSSLSGDDTASGTVPVGGVPDSYELSDALSGSNSSSEVGTCTENNGINAFSLGGDWQVTQSSAVNGSDDQFGSWGSVSTYERGPGAISQTGNATTGYEQSSPTPTSSFYAYGDEPFLVGYGGFLVEQPAMFHSPVEGSALSVVEALGDAPFEIEVNSVDESTGYQFNLEYFNSQSDSYTPYEPPLSVIAYRGGEPVGPGTADSGFDPPGNLSNATVAPDTDSASANGLPSQEADKLTDFVQNTGTSDGVSRGAAPSPTATLVALAAAGRNPADITLPTQGSEGTDPPAGSNLAPGGYVGGGWNPLNWGRWALTGNANASDEQYNAAKGGASAYIAPRLASTAQAVGGILETSAGAVLTGAVVTAPAGVVLVAHGVDTTLTGVQGMAAGKTQRTVTAQAVTGVTGSETTGTVVDTAIPLVANGVGALATKALAARNAVQIEAKIVSATAENAAAAEIEAGVAGAAGENAAAVQIEAAAVGAGASRNVPNPYGRLGGPAHQATVAERAAELQRQGYTIEGGGGILPERAVQTATGRRFPDITAADPLGQPCYENIGRTTGAGNPVAREVRALDDIERATGTRPAFTPYDR